MGLARNNIMMLLALCLASCFLSSHETTSYYPLEKGNYWIYEGESEEQMGHDIYKTKQLWKIEVLDVFPRGHITGYAIRKTITDIKSGKVDVLREGIVRVGPNAYYSLDINKFDRLKNKKDILYDLLSSDDIILDMPLVVGKRFGDPEQLTRDDGYYCYVVMGDNQIKLNNVKGIESGKHYHSYDLRYYTLPGESTETFVPGIGYVSYRYSHHGSVSEYNMRLIEFHKNN